MSNSDWWSRKLSGTPQPQQQPYQRQYQQTYAPPPQQPPYQQQHQAPVPQDDPTVPKSFMEALASWGAKGGAAMRSEGLGNCPSCGTTNVFGMSNTGSVSNQNSGVSARTSARCFECGWKENGVIQGDQSNWV